MINISGYGIFLFRTSFSNIEENTPKVLSPQGTGRTFAITRRKSEGAFMLIFKIAERDVNLVRETR